MGQQGKQAMNLACKLSIPKICNNEQENKIIKKKWAQANKCEVRYIIGKMKYENITC